MCLALPGKIVEINDNKVKIDYGQDIFRQADSSLVPCSIGDYVLVQAGFVVEIIDKKRAEDMLELI